MSASCWVDGGDCPPSNCCSTYETGERMRAAQSTDVEPIIGEIRARLAAVQALIDAAKAISPSDRMTVYVGDLEHALGQRDQRARTRTGANVSGDAGGAEQ